MIKVTVVPKVRPHVLSRSTHMMMLVRVPKYRAHIMVFFACHVMELSFEIIEVTLNPGPITQFLSLLR